MGPQGWSGRVENLAPQRDSIPDRPDRSQSLYRLSYPAHKEEICYSEKQAVWCCTREDRSAACICTKGEISGSYSGNTGMCWCVAVQLGASVLIRAANV